MSAYDTLASQARKLLFEDVYQQFSTQSFRAGDQFKRQFDDSQQSKKVNQFDDHQFDQESTLGEELPIGPDDQMANPSTVEKPPVEDPEYRPTNADELGFALAALAKDIPSDKVAYIYEKVSKFIDKIEKKAVSISVEEEFPQGLQNIDKQEEIERLESVTEGVLEYLEKKLSE